MDKQDSNSPEPPAAIQSPGQLPVSSLTDLTQQAEQDKVSRGPSHRVDPRRLLRTFLVLILLVLLGSSSGYWLIHLHARTKSATNVSLGQNFTVGNVKVVYVNMPGLADYKAGNINGMDEKQGHYLYGDAQVICGQCAQPDWGNGKVIYDGITIYNGEIDTSSVRLSDNGLHYSYGVPATNGMSEKFYVDNQMLPTSSNIPVGGSLVAIANSGQDYAYATMNNLYVDSSARYVAPSQGVAISGPAMSSNLSDFVTGDDSNTPSTFGVLESVVYDGKVLTSSGESGDMHMTISKNGQHYIYATNGVVVYDGKSISMDKNQSVESVAIADSGLYAFLACNQAENMSTIYVGTNTFSNGSCATVGALPSIVFNDEGSHFFYFSNNQPGDKAVIDGKPIMLTGQVSSADFLGDTLYVYRWVN